LSDKKRRGEEKEGQAGRGEGQKNGKQITDPARMKKKKENPRAKRRKSKAIKEYTGNNKANEPQRDSQDR